MKVGVLATMIFGVLIGYPIASFAGLAPDADGDGVPDVLDNCSAVPNAGTLDCDTDQDGYGNRCDCDLTNAGGTTGVCAGPDLIAWKAAFKTTGDLNADHNCSGGILGDDLIIWKGLFKNTPIPASGLICANPNVVNGCPN